MPNTEAAAAQEDLTLGQINERIEFLNLKPKLTPQSARVLTEHVDRAKFIRALTVADENEEAWRWLQGCLNRAQQQAQVATEGDDATPAPEPTPQSRAPAREDTPRNRPSADRDRYSVHAYGGKAALCFEADQTRRGAATVSIDAADATAPREYDWQSKIRIQLTQNELPQVAAVFLGLLPGCKFSSHGQASNKSIEFRRQTGKANQLMFVRVIEAEKKAKAVPISNADCFRVEALIMHQLKVQHPYLDGTMLMAMLRSIAVAEQD